MNDGSGSAPGCAAAAVVDVNAIIDDAPLSRLQLRVIFLCLLAMILEGYHLYVVGYVGPELSRAWGIAPGQLGIVLTAGVLGSAVGNMTVGPVADRFGRRALIIGSVAAFGLLAVLSAGATSVGEFILYRVIIGFGLGVTLPNAVSLAAEFAPRRWRGFAAVIVYSGFSLGASLGGLLAPHLVPIYSWKSVFVIGGVAALLLALVMVWLLPESVRFLALRRPESPKLRRLLGQISPAGALPLDARFAAAEGVRRQPLFDLFRGGRVTSTLMIWLVISLDAAVLNSILLWLPTLGARLTGGAAAGAHFNVVMLLTGIMGAIAVGFFMDRFGSYRVLIPLKAVGSLAVLALGVALAAPPIFLAVAVGICLVGGIGGAQGLLARLYPTEMRATGVGWTVGTSRFVGILAPLAIGWFIGRGVSPQLVIGACALPIVIVVVALIVMSRDPFGRAAATLGGHG